jgi:hypothetical protein
MTPHLRWVKGGDARVLELTASSIKLESTTPSPPGSRIDGVLIGSDRVVRVKIHASRKDTSGRFQLEGRPIDLSRELREELITMLLGDAAPPA